MVGKKWEENNIAFHESEANPLLVKHFKALSLAGGSRIFLPLCGKTLGIGWLLSHGYCVAGAELSEIAIEQLFKELGMEPEVSKGDDVHHYSAKTSTFLSGIYSIYLAK